MGGTFWAYWQSHGGLAQQGYPLSDEFAEVSALNAWERALIDAGVSEMNLVPVSSVLPAGIEWKKDPSVELPRIPRGTIVFGVFAKQAGADGACISAGIALAFRTDRQGGYIVESEGNMPMKVS